MSGTGKSGEEIATIIEALRASLLRQNLRHAADLLSALREARQHSAASDKERLDCLEREIKTSEDYEDFQPMLIVHGGFRNAIDAILRRDKGQLYGIWNGESWIKADSGNDFKTDSLSNAVQTAQKLRADGATGLSVKCFVTAQPNK